MSTHNIGAFDLPKAVASLCALIGIVAAVACVGLGHNDDDERFYGYFLRDAEAMQDMGLPVYWLGREFNAGALTFQGPYGLEFGGEVEGGGIFMRYLPQGTDPGLELTIYSCDAWELVKDRLLDPQLLSNEGEVTRQTVTVKGRQAELIFVPQFTRPVGQLRLILELDEVFILAVARSGGQRPDGTDYSLFIRNPDLLIQVMEDLRPYPE